MTMTNHEVAAELLQMQEHMLALLDDAERLLRVHNNESPEHDMTYERARQYWIAHMKCALSNDHGYVSRGMCTMADTIAELEERDVEEGDENEYIFE